MASIVKSTNAMSVGGSTQREMHTLFASIHADLVALQTAITTLTAQLDADAGVTDTDYAANCDPTLTTTE